MANVALGQKYRIVIACRMADQNALNVKLLRINAAGAATLSVQAMADALSTLYAALYKAIINENSVYYGVKVSLVERPQINTNEAVSRVGTGAGTVIGDALPGQVCGLIKLTTALAGRRNRGRIYVPFPSESQATADGSPTVAYGTALTTFGDHWDGNVDLDGGADGWVGNYGVWPTMPPGADFVDFNGFSIRTRFATQRRRSQIAGGDGVPF